MGKGGDGPTMDVDDAQERCRAALKWLFASKLLAGAAQLCTKFQGVAWLAEAAVVAWTRVGERPAHTTAQRHP